MEDGTEVRLETSPVLEIMPSLSPDRVYHEVSHF
jgi:hypothetical protein